MPSVLMRAQTAPACAFFELGSSAAGAAGSGAGSGTAVEDTTPMPDGRAKPNPAKRSHKRGAPKVPRWKDKVHKPHPKPRPKRVPLAATVEPSTGCGLGCALPHGCVCVRCRLMGSCQRL